MIPFFGAPLQKMCRIYRS